MTGTTGLARGSKAPRKLAIRLADRILDEISHSGWKAGTVLGSEEVLVERYGVSRAVFRESLRLLEHLGIAATRRGPGGGLAVSEPSTVGVVQAFLVYLTYADTSIGDVFEARTSVERIVVRLAAERCDERHIRTLRASVADHVDPRALEAPAHNHVHTMIGRATGNPAAELFIDVLWRMAARWSSPDIGRESAEQAMAESARAHVAIVDAIAAGDADAAGRIMEVHLAALGDWLGRGRRSPRSLDLALAGTTIDEKLASKIARSIIVEIADRGWPVGESLGSEPDLLERFHVSRSALREAVRVLEYHEVATMRRGPNGGLIVTEPGIAPIVRAAMVCLEQRNITAADLTAIRVGIESDAIAKAIGRVTADEIEELRAAVTENARTDFQESLSNHLSIRIAELTGNPAMTLFVRLLVELTHLHASFPPRGSSQSVAISAEVERAHHAIIDALAAGDEPLARRRMAKHLLAIEPQMR